MNESLGENVLISVPFAALDIGGTNSAAAAGGTAAANHWVDMSNHGKLTIYIQVGTQTAGDSVLTITVQQASASDGTGVKTVKAFTMADGTLDTTGDNLIIEVDAAEMDVANTFTHLRVLLAMTDNANTDAITAVYVRSRPRSSKKSWDNYQVRLPQDQAPN